MEDKVFNDLPLLLAVPRAAELLEISRAAAYRLAASGDLPVRRIGDRSMSTEAAADPTPADRDKTKRTHRALPVTKRVARNGKVSYAFQIDAGTTRMAPATGGATPTQRWPRPNVNTPAGGRGHAGPT